MSNTTVNYRLRIRNVTDSADALVLTSVPGGTNPWIIKEPTGDGQELDPINGTVRTGQYTVRCADPVIPLSSPPSRIITSQLFDTAGRQLFLSRRTYVEVSYNLGSSWTGVIAGYLTNYNLVDAITWEFQIGDTRRIENTRTAFDGTSTTFAARGCLFGGPIAGGPWGPINDRGGWKFKVATVSSAIYGGAGSVVTYNFVSGYRGINDPVTTRLDDLLNSDSNNVGLLVNQKARSYYSQNAPQYQAASGYYGSYPTAFGYPGFPGLTLLIHELVGGANKGQFMPGGYGTSPGSPYPINLLGPAGVVDFHGTTFPVLIALWPPGISLPSVGDIHSISCYTAAPTDASPVYVDAHPVDIVTGLYTDAGIPYDATAAANLKTLLGSTLRVALRVTSSQTLLDFLEKTLFGPFGFSSRTNPSGVAQLFATRLKQSALPTTTIGTADLQDATGIVFQNDEQLVVNLVRFKSESYWAYNPNTDTDTSSRPLDSVLVSKLENVVTNADTSTYSTQEVVYDIPGMIHDASGLAQDMNSFTQAIALEMFDRFGRGAPVADALAILVGSDTGFNIGDEIYVEPAHFPNLNYRFGDNPSVGARIMQVLRRTESSAGPLVKVVDAGSAQQPVTPAATISIAQSVDWPRTLALFTVTNAAAINAAGSLVVAIQWATGASSPTNGVPFARYPAAGCPTVAVALPPVTPGSTVWVRARTETPGARPSAWTAWTSVALTAVAVPTGLSFSSILENTATFNWTNANATDLIDVYAFQGASPPANWAPYFVCTLPAGSTSVVVRNLLGPTLTYQGAVFHRDPVTGVIGAILTGSFTTGSTFAAQLPTPLAAFTLTQSSDASHSTGIALGLYAADPSLDILIQRAPDVAGSPGSFATIAQVRGTTGVYVDLIAGIGTKYWYQAQHVLSGATSSAFTNPSQGTVASVSLNPAQPPFLNAAPVLTITIASNGSVTVTTAKASAIGTGPSNAASMKWSASTSALPSVATNIASGTLVTSGAPYFVVADLGVNLNLGDTVYVTMTYFDVFGVAQTSVQGQATRASVLASKTLVIPGTGFLPGLSSGMHGTYLLDQTNGYLVLNSSLSAAQSDNLTVPVVMPQGATITRVQCGLYSGPGTAGTVSWTLYRNASGTITSIGGGTSGAGAGNVISVLSGLSETTAGNTYYVNAIFQGSASTTAGTLRYLYIVVFYTVPDVVSTI